MEVIFRPAAAADAEDGYPWYENRRPKLGEEFLSEVGAAVDRISVNPQRYPVVH